MVYALTATTLIVLLTGVLLWQEIKDSKLQLLVMLLIASLIADISSLVTIHYFKSNIISYNLFTLVETPLVLFLIGSWISPSKFSNLIHYLSAAFFYFGYLRIYLLLVFIPPLLTIRFCSGELLYYLLTLSTCIN